MAITLGTYTFDPAHTTVRETHQEIGGRRERVVEIVGLVVGESTVSAIDAVLDAILDAASPEDYSAALSIRPGRQLFVRRTAFKRERSSDAMVGSFELALHARDPYEHSLIPTSQNWSIATSGATFPVAAGGNHASEPVITITAEGDLVNPAISDGVWSIVYNGTVLAGSVLVFDGPNARVTLDGADVTPYTTGLFPEIAPEGTTLTYTDDAASTHDAEAVVSYHDRWW
ncbi:MAG: hypothetical protein AMXMBFR82_21000 [Candidatus Hydrogenedentota bacterium]